MKPDKVKEKLQADIKLPREFEKQHPGSCDKLIYHFENELVKHVDKIGRKSGNTN